MDFGDDGPDYVDNILSREESADVISMMIMADESGGNLQLPSFHTSSQTGGKSPTRRPTTPPLSPVYLPNSSTSKLIFGHDDNAEFADTNNKTKDSPTPIDNINNQKNIDTNIMDVKHQFRGNDYMDGKTQDLGTWDETKNSTAGPGSSGLTGPDLLMGDTSDVTPDDKNDLVPKHVSMGTNVTTDVTDTTLTTDGQEKQQDDESVGDNSAGTSRRLSFGSDAQEDWDHSTRLDDMAEKMTVVEEILSMMNIKSSNLGSTVKDLTTSLEFSQAEIEELKKENAELKKKLDVVETDDKRTQFQARQLEDNVDRLETVTKKKNLIFEGVLEAEGRREEIEKTIGRLFDQLEVPKGMNFEACYRMGPYLKERTRPIMVSFEKQSDRDLLYSKRMELKRTTDYQRVWVNEDLGPLSKRKRSIIRMITKEAALQGIDCKSGKYAIHIDRVKYNSDNLADLPPSLHPTQLKQMQVNQTTLAYQSEYAPFSNFYACPIKIGIHDFLCAEQAFQIVRAKTHNKHLIATKIYLSRDVHYIKQLGAEVGTSPEWENRRYEVMYTCLKKKFAQNPDLQELLLKTGDLELVEATPDVLWDCGATLSSNVIRRGGWRGKNKHGEILMVVRNELRQRKSAQARQKDN